MSGREVYEADEKRAGRRVALVVGGAGSLDHLRGALPNHPPIATGRVADVDFVAYEFPEGGIWKALLNATDQRAADSRPPLWPPLPPRPAEPRVSGYGPMALEGALIALIALLGWFTMRNIMERSAGTWSAAPVAVKNLKPDGSPDHWLSLGESLRLAWSPEVTDAVHRLELAAEPGGFASPVLKADAIGDSFTFNPAPAEGKYQWRLVNSRTGAVAGPFALAVAHLEAPVVIAPLPGQSIDIVDGAGAVSVNFAWRCRPAGGATYHAQISGQVSFAQTVAEFKTTGCRWPDIQLSAGAYYLRLRTVVENKMSLWGSPVHFRVNGGRPLASGPSEDD